MSSSGVADKNSSVGVDRIDSVGQKNCIGGSSIDLQEKTSD